MIPIRTPEKLARCASCCWLVGLLLTSGCGKGDPAAPTVRPEPEVQLSSPARRRIARRVGQPAFVNAFEQTAMYPKIAGYIKAWNVDIGARIHKDQVLADLFVPELESQYEEKQAELARDQVLIQVAEQLVEVAQSRLQASTADVERAKADVETFRSGVDRWESEVKRLTGMVAQGVVARQILDESQKQLKSTSASRDASLATVVSVQADEASRRADLGKARADVDAARARTKVGEAVERRYRALVSYMKLTSPYDGIVVRRNANTGDFVQPAAGDKSNDRDTMLLSAAHSEPIYVVARVDLVRIFVDVPEMFADYVRQGTEAHVRLQALDNDEIRGAVARTSWSLNVQTRTLRAEIDLPNPDARILPGMYAYAEVLITRDNVLTVPLAATVELGNQNCCYLLEDGTAVKTPIETGLNDGEWVEVFKKQVNGQWVPFDGQEQIILGTLAEISGGQKVKVLTTSTPAAEPKSLMSDKPVERDAGAK